jgi:hypothetical protein
VVIERSSILIFKGDIFNISYLKPLWLPKVFQNTVRCPSGQQIHPLLKTTVKKEEFMSYSQEQLLCWYLDSGFTDAHRCFSVSTYLSHNQSFLITDSTQDHTMCYYFSHYRKQRKISA